MESADSHRELRSGHFEPVSAFVSGISVQRVLRTVDLTQHDYALIGIRRELHMVSDVHIPNHDGADRLVITRRHLRLIEHDLRIVAGRGHGVPHSDLPDEKDHLISRHHFGQIPGGMGESSPCQGGDRKKEKTEFHLSHQKFTGGQVSQKA